MSMRIAASWGHALQEILDPRGALIFLATCIDLPILLVLQVLLVLRNFE